MFVLIRNGTSTVQRRIDQRHVTSLRRSLYSRSLFESQEIGNVSLNSFSLLDSQRDRNQRESQTTRPSIQSHASSSQQVISSPVSNLQRPAFYKSKDALESLSYSILSGSSRDTAMNLLGATMNSRSAYRTIVYEPLEASLGLSFYNTRKRTYQYNSRFHFSSKTSKESGYSTSAKIPTPKSPTQTSLNPFAAIDPQVLLRNLVDMTWSLTKALVNFILRLPGNSWFYLTHPNERKEKIAEIKAHAKKEFDHYLMGSKVSNSKWWLF